MMLLVFIELTTFFYIGVTLKKLLIESVVSSSFQAFVILF